ncbi:hypothetical protein [Anoxynatronum buryatiense]|uniref:Uncharacterized protein n=1 Tax=Anoxynatronum buryatiense TaxID=489973 RepID=A0AA46AHP0_9CLOT|nr:hypothetical protein [Anoxynatronum buryatiense]SMP41405.1 hypothetical protein SAMN06296020_101502 [Anoxynatronum buryatiense]
MEPTIHDRRNQQNATTDHRERRKGPDIWLRSIQWIGMISWGLMLPLLFLIDRAKPEFETFFDKMFDIQVRSTWDQDVFRWAFYLMVGLLVLSAGGLAINKSRKRRREDYYRINLVIIFLLSAAGILYYLMNFI